MAQLGQVVDLSLEEERVVDRHEGREVLVQGGWLHAESACHLRQAEPVDPLLGHHLPGDGQNLLNRLLAPSRPAVRPGCGRGGLRLALGHVWLWVTLSSVAKEPLDSKS